MPDSEGRVLVKVPRKAELQILGRQERRLGLSLYAQDDASFRVPAFRMEIRAEGWIKIPAGDHLASLSSDGKAPDLHLLSAPPGSRRSLTWSARDGWSLLLRCRSAKPRQDLSGARVEVIGTEGFGSPGAPPVRAESASQGLALISGIRHTLADATIEAAGLMARRVSGLSASPGTFAFREVELEEGGSLRARILLDGAPARGVACRVLEVDPNPMGPAPEPVVRYEGRTGADGLCRSGKLPAGPYTLRVRAEGGRSFLDRTVALNAGEETAVEVALSRIRVSGTVTRGREPAPGYVVTLSDADEMKPNATSRDAEAEATTDGEGSYEMVVWKPGEYFAILSSPEGSPATFRRLWLDRDEDDVDFQVEESGVGGVVVDEKGEPLPESAVYFTWNQLSHRMASTGAKGAFFFPVTEAGDGEVKAMKSGYVPAEPVTVAVRPEAVTPPLVVRLKKAAVIAGRLVSAGGPAAGARIQSYRTSPAGVALFLGRTAAKADGSFEVASAETGPTNLYVSGAGCPLSGFVVQPSQHSVALRCAGPPASLELTLKDPRGTPLPGRTVLVRTQGAFIPTAVLIEHLGQFRIQAASDGLGRLFLVGLAPGSYELYLGDVTSPEMVALGSPEGFLTASSLAPFTTIEVEATVE
ncbi:MAG: carboxypeptidase-like regulatory domain-containing protein [Acidobacteriota bacterium]